jgi:hypothetical protein
MTTSFTSHSFTGTKRKSFSRHARALSMLVLAFFSVQVARAQLVYAVTVTGNLISFDAAAPGTILSNTAITGITAGQALEGLDFRPATGQLYALGYTAADGQTQVYTIKPTTGVATPVGPAITLATGLINIGFDFNPVPDRIRLTSSTDQSYRLNPNNGTLAATDGTLAFAVGDPNAGANPNVGAVGYINSVAGASATTLYGYDFGLQKLVIINPPNSGTLNTVAGAGSGLTTSNTIGLDLDILTDKSTGVNTAYLTADVSGTSNNFYTVNLSTGVATLVGTIAGGKINKMAVSFEPPPHSKLVYAVAAGNLITFKSDAPGTILSIVAVTNLGASESIVGMDFRPATGQLYAVGSLSRLYTINLTTGAATQVGSDGAFTLSGTKFGVDFNPVPDRIRVVSDLDQNLRLNPNDGTLSATDGTLAYAAGDANQGTNPQVGAGGYINSYAGATSTTLYVLDYSLNALLIQNPPNSGTLNTAATIPLDFLGEGLDLDVSSDQGTATNTAYLSANTTTNTSVFYRLNLTTGSLATLGNIGGGFPVSAMAVYLPPPPAVKLVYAITSANDLVSFNSNTPGTILSTVALTGITPTLPVEGMDFRPATGELYVIGYNGTNGATQLYTVNTTSGLATPVGVPLILAGNMGRLAVDFNPLVDRIRLIGSTGQNYRLNPNDGTLSATDTQLSYAVGDAHAGVPPVVHAVAYSNNFAGTAGTTLYYYDFNLDNVAVTLPPVSPNAGVITTIGLSGITANADGIDMDIFTNQSTGVNTAYFTAGVTGSPANFYTLDFTSGEAKFIGAIGSGLNIKEMAVGDPSSILPVSLTDFTVKKSGRVSLLSWTTKTEINNSHFMLERSTDGRTFKAISDKINSKAANGNSTLSLNYDFTDQQPAKGINYYRLLQADKDGSLIYSQVLKLRFDGRIEVSLYPNPVRNMLNIKAELSDAVKLQVRLTDVSGKMIMARDYKQQQGTWNAQINLSGLQTGMYYLQVIDGASVVYTQTINKN